MRAVQVLLYPIHSPVYSPLYRRRISRYGYHSSVANSTPRTVARIGVPVAQPRLYTCLLDRSYRGHTDWYLLIFYCQPMLPNRCPGIRLPTDTGYRELPIIPALLLSWTLFPGPLSYLAPHFFPRSLGYRTRLQAFLSLE